MKSIALFAALALSACASPLASVPGIPAAPVVVADQTVLDEQAGAAVELAYKAFRTGLELATDAGKLRGANATKAAALDNRAYVAVQAVRAAYRTGNATSYGEAVKQARVAITAALAAIAGN